LVRDSFTFPKDEYQAIAGLKQKALGFNHSVKKSEILRAGLMLLNGLNDKAFLSGLAKVPALKTGRPAKVLIKEVRVFERSPPRFVCAVSHPAS
jgi:hypothetical protein